MSEKKEKFNQEMEDEKNAKTFIVAGVLLEKDGKYLLVQEAQKKAYGLWNLPAGKVEKDVTIEETAIREAKEESGFDVELISKIGAFQENSEKPVKNVFLAKIIGGEQIENSDEILAVKWFTFDEIKKMQDKLRGEHIMAAIKLLENKNKSEEYLNNWKRAVADFENYKKRQLEAQKDFAKFANMDLIMQILPVIDNFHASTDHVPADQKENPWVVGIMHIQKQLEQVLKDNGVEEIKVKEGDEFDPNIHEAVKQEEGNKKKEESENVVKKIIQQGYKIDGKVIRAARVVVE